MNMKRQKTKERGRLVLDLWWVSAECSLFDIYTISLIWACSFDVKNPLPHTGISLVLVNLLDNWEWLK